MNEIAKYHSGEWTLTHGWTLDRFGFQRNSFELSRITEGGMKIIYPFIGKMRVNNYYRSTALGGDDISPYETHEYAEMLGDEVSRIRV